ncbi:lipid A biosynthesis lauroyl acyltransferase [Pseudohoeflea coraliihabitans]|uniref:Lipid A biosynthesis lauroyl acyltransferase n=1 Tax=Pseudohoeflea coraliihabitans TaxID=2860393 RepID=A0ABS6WIW5_9HYPH|nr:lipid A biosynthesis lauroyl acyltransferase [Pseudohoeflea sp. DP4N28-3]MBW3095735.1 lipid A biosynthesis lauroyl acyltransferase [Pseudohoeflea sp. DP4N28-3]
MKLHHAPPSVIRLANRLGRVKDWMIALVAVSVLRIAALFPADASINFVDRLARRIGPRTFRHKLALANLERAYPEKSADERERIARDMWGNMARLAVEYVFLDQIFDFDPEQPDKGRIEVEGREIFSQLRAAQKPFIVFTAHTGNFELLPIAAATYDLHTTVLFRPPNNPYVAERILAARRGRMGNLVPSQAGAAIALARKLEDGEGVGMLVDQKFHRGPKTTFFGLPVISNRLLPKLARQFDCDVYPARCIRLPGGRFRLSIEPALELPRNADGQIDVVATCQVLNDKVETWVREYPGQWQWFHDRWNIKSKL